MSTLKISDAASLDITRADDTLLVVNTKRLGQMLCMTPRSAKAFVESKGLKPFNAGRGKKPRWRWVLNDVKNLLVALSADNKQQAAPVSKESHQGPKSLLDVASVLDRPA